MIILIAVSECLNCFSKSLRVFWYLMKESKCSAFQVEVKVLMSSCMLETRRQLAEFLKKSSMFSDSVPLNSSNFTKS